MLFGKNAFLIAALLIPAVSLEARAENEGASAFTTSFSSPSPAPEVKQSSPEVAQQLPPIAASEEAPAGQTDQKYLFCKETHPILGKVTDQSEEQLAASLKKMADANCASVEKMAAAADPTVNSVMKNAAGLCRLTYLEGGRNLSRMCGVEAKMLLHVGSLGVLLSQSSGSTPAERIEKASKIADESELQLNAAKTVTTNIVTLHRALAANLGSEGLTRLGEVCKSEARVKSAISFHELLPDIEKRRAYEQQEDKKNRSLAAAFANCAPALKELEQALSLNRDLGKKFDAGADRYQASMTRAKAIQDRIGQIGTMLHGDYPSPSKNPDFQRDLYRRAQDDAGCRVNPLICEQLTRKPDFITKTALQKGGAIERLSDEIVKLATDDVKSFGGDPKKIAGNFFASTGLSLEAAAAKVPKAEDEKEVETLASMTKGELLKGLRTEYVLDLMGDVAGSSRAGVLSGLLAQGTLEALHDHVIEHAPMNARSIAFGVAKSATGLAGPIAGSFGDGLVDLVDTGDYRAGIAAVSGDLIYEGGKWALERYAPLVSAQVGELQPYAIAGYYTYKAVDYSVFRIGQAEIEKRLPAGISLEQSNYEYVQGLYEKNDISLDPRKSYFGLWGRASDVLQSKGK